MKVFIFSGSNNTIDSVSERLARELSDGLQKARIETALYLASHSDIKFCEGCSRCFCGKECQLQDDMAKIKEDLFASDVIVILSPVYAHQVPAPMKNLIDRLTYLTHLMPFAGKACVIISVSSTNGNKPVEEYLHKIFVDFTGASSLDTISILGDMMNERVQSSYISNLIDQIRHFKRHPELHATPEQEEGFKRYNIDYQKHPESPEAQIWFKQGYHQKNSFEEIISERIQSKQNQ